MAVPKKRRSSSKQGKKRSHLALKPTQLVQSKTGAIPRRLVKAVSLGLVKLKRS